MYEQEYVVCSHGCLTRCGVRMRMRVRLQQRSIQQADCRQALCGTTDCACTRNLETEVMRLCAMVLSAHIGLSMMYSIKQDNRITQTSGQDATAITLTCASASLACPCSSLHCISHVILSLPERDLADVSSASARTGQMPCMLQSHISSCGLMLHAHCCRQQCHTEKSTPDSSNGTKMTALRSFATVGKWTRTYGVCAIQCMTP